MTDRLTLRDRIIMAARAGTYDLSMIHGENLRPRCRMFFMTSVTLIRATNVGWNFTTGCNPIVTVNTITYKPGMVRHATRSAIRRYPGCRRVARITV
jgi:hypothetical protein